MRAKCAGAFHILLRRNVFVTKKTLELSSKRAQSAFVVGELKTKIMPMRSRTKSKSIARGVALATGVLVGFVGAHAQTVIPESFALPVSALDTSKPGFAVRVFQATGAQLENSLARTEAQIAGLLINPATGQPYENIADLSLFNADGVYEEESMISSMSRI